MPEDTWLDRLAELAPDEPFTTAMAAKSGLNHEALHELTVSGFIRRLIHSVYVAAAVPDSLGLRCRAMSLVVPPDGFACDRTAAWIHAGDRALAPNEHLELPRLSVFRPSDRGRLRTPLAASGERAILSRDLMDLHGLRVTTPLRTALDLGRLQPTADLKLHGMDTMLGLGTFSREQLLAEIPRFNRQRGVVELRVLAPLADGGSESFSESALRRRWHGAGLPFPRTQISIEVDGREVFRLDMGLEELLFAAEYDGEEWHGAPQQDHDRIRRAWLADELGWLIEVFRKEQVFGARQDAERRLRLGFDAARARRGLPRTYFI